MHRNRPQERMADEIPWQVVTFITFGGHHDCKEQGKGFPRAGQDRATAGETTDGNVGGICVRRHLAHRLGVLRRAPGAHLDGSVHLGGILND